MVHEMNGKRVHMYSNKKDREHHTHQETWSRNESHTCETIMSKCNFFFWFGTHKLFLFFLSFFSLRVEFLLKTDGGYPRFLSFFESRVFIEN